MPSDLIFSITFLIFTGAAILATLVLYTRQSLLVAYILLGVILGPWGLKLIADPSFVYHIGEIGIIFLLFLLGLHLHPQNLIHLLKKVTWVTLLSSIVFAALGYGVSRWFGFNHTESCVVAATTMFSSTIIGLKLLPTSVLHHQHTGELMISVLLLQDIIAIITLAVLNGSVADGFTLTDVLMVGSALPFLVVVGFLVERYVLVKLLARFDRTQEYIFLLSIGWCLGMARLGQYIGLPYEVGAFVAGVSLAASPIALYIAESLKPLRDFFLVMFFFSVGASFNLIELPNVLIPAIVLSILLLLIKPYVFYYLFRWLGEIKTVAGEVGVRLAQGSEFSLIIVVLALENSLINNRTAYFIQAVTIFTFIASSYIVVLRYPTPIALTDKMRRD